MKKKLIEIIESPHIHIALATGASIIIMAYFSKRILSRSIDYLPNAIPPFFIVIYEVVANKYNDHKICTTWYWIAAIFASTAIIIFIYLF